MNLCSLLTRSPPKDDEHNIYIRLKCFYFPFFGDLFFINDFKQEKVSNKMTKDEFSDIVKMVNLICNRASLQLKLLYGFIVIFLILLYFLFPEFLIVNRDDMEENQLSILLPIVLFFMGCSVFICQVSKLGQEMAIKVQKVLRAENCLRYINRGICWKLHPSKNYLHINLNYTSNSHQYLIGQTSNAHDGTEEYVPYFDLENGEIRGLDSETEKMNHIEKTLFCLGFLCCFLCVTQLVRFTWLN